jgi:hypothetical protein
MLPDEPTDEERLEELNQDNETPFRPADPNPSPTGGTDIPDDHPQTDTNMDLTEQYDEGISGAAEVEDTSTDRRSNGF